ncbi:MAG: hypothetical protein ACTFAK_13110 [Candidatus Electronema sp. VV]
MAALQTEYFARCIGTLERAFKALHDLSPDDDLHDIYRAACVKEFEIILEQTGKLLKKCLKPYFATPKQVDQLNFKDIFRHAAKHGLMELACSPLPRSWASASAPAMKAAMSRMWC